MCIENQLQMIKQCLFLCFLGLMLFKGFHVLLEAIEQVCALCILFTGSRVVSGNTQTVFALLGWQALLSPTTLCFILLNFSNWACFYLQQSSMSVRWNQWRLSFPIWTTICLLSFCIDFIIHFSCNNCHGWLPGCLCEKESLELYESATRHCKVRFLKIQVISSNMTTVACYNITQW